MQTLGRYLVSALLCLVLPLQASAALVRAITMMPPASTEQALVEVASPQAPVQVAHAIGVPHQHGAHAHHENLPKQKAGKAGKDGKAAPVSHKSKHAKGECPTCAKCCLLAAAAPPPALVPASSIPVSRVTFVAAALFIPSFLPDGPERPPRFSLAA
jgi:hypothetical protein